MMKDGEEISNLREFPNYKLRKIILENLPLAIFRNLWDIILNSENIVLIRNDEIIFLLFHPDFNSIKSF